MKVELRARLFDDERLQMWVLGFLQRALAGRIFLSIRSPAADGYNAWLTKQPRMILSAWEAALDTTTSYEAAAKLKGVSVDAVSESDWVDRVLSPADAMTVVDAPFRIMLENARSDRAFFMCALAREERTLIERLEAADRLIFFPGGGIGELRELVTTTVVAKPHRALTHAILFDSDSPAPGLRSDVAAELSELCAATGLPFHCLARRAIENYLPKAALYDHFRRMTQKQRQKRKGRLEAFFKMSDSQRHHFRMKCGWSKPPSETEAALYGDLDQITREALENGVSGDLDEHYKLADRDVLHDQLVKDGAVVELRQFIDAVFEMIRVPQDG